MKFKLRHMRRKIVIWSRIYQYKLIWIFKNKNLNCFRNICTGVPLPAQNVTELFCPQDPQVASINNDSWLVQKMIIMNNEYWFVQKIIIKNNRNNNYNCPKKKSSFSASTTSSASSKSTMWKMRRISWRCPLDPYISIYTYLHISSYTAFSSCLSQGWLCRWWLRTKDATPHEKESSSSDKSCLSSKEGWQWFSRADYFPAEYFHVSHQRPPDFRWQITLGHFRPIRFYQLVFFL